MRRGMGGGAVPARITACQSKVHAITDRPVTIRQKAHNAMLPMPMVGQRQTGVTPWG